MNYDPDPIMVGLIDRICQKGQTALDAGLNHKDVARRHRTARLMTDFLRDAGERYHDATLDNYRCDLVGQAQLLARLHAYLDDADQQVAAGNGIFAIGPAGSGKTHLLIGAGKELIRRHAFQVVRTTGARLFARMRDSIAANLPEGHIVRPLVAADVLIVDDPIPPSVGELTDYQKATLFALVDARYERRRPTWLASNVSDGAEAFERLGRATVDRLRHDAMILKFNWGTYRRSQPEAVDLKPDAATACGSCSDFP